MKKISKSIIIALIMNLSIFCSSSWAESMVQINAKDMSSPVVAVEAKLPQVVGMPDKLLQEIINHQLEKNFYNSVKEYLTASQTAKEELEKNSQQSSAVEKFSFKADYRVQLNNEKILSITQTNYSYTGGAHGLSTMYGTTVNLQTGKIYKLADLFLPNKDYKKAIDEIITQQIQLRDDKMDINFKGISNEQPFYLEQDNLVIYFPVYEIAPYVMGSPTFKIPFSSLSNYLHMSRIK